MADLFDELGVNPATPPEPPKDLFDELGVEPSRPNTYIPPPQTDPAAKENIYFESTGEAYPAPPGTSKVIGDMMNDPVFGASVSQDTTDEGEFRITIRPRRLGVAPLDETGQVDAGIGEAVGIGAEIAANTEAITSNLALIALTYGLTDVDTVADYIADRRKALTYAQTNQPEYMQKFYSDFENSNGAFESTAVILSNPAALGRIAVTQAPNSIIPLAGMLAGAVTAGPVGGVAGSFAGTTVSEVGAYLDSSLMAAGFDPSNAASLRKAFENKDFIDGLRRKAEARGLSVAVVDGLFNIVGGRFLRKIGEGATKTQKVVAGAKEVGLQSAGEGVGELAGQAGAGDEISYKDAVLESMAGITTSVGQTAIINAYEPVTKGVKSVVFKGGEGPAQETETDTDLGLEPEIEPQTDEEVAAEAEVATSAPVEGVPAQESQKIVKDFLNGKEVDTSQYDTAKQKAIQDVLDRAKPVRDKVVKGRLKKLDADAETKLAEIDALEAEIELAKNEKRATKAKQNKLDKLTDQWLDIDEERGALSTISEFDSIAADMAVKEDITVKGEDLVRAEKRTTQEALRATNKAFREARKAAKQDVKAAQQTMIAALEDAGLSKEDRTRFMRQITDVQDGAQLARKAPKIQARVEKILNQRLREQTINKIQKEIKRARSGETIAVDYVKAMEALTENIDLKSRTPRTLATLQATQDYLANNPGAAVPKRVRQKLELLNKTRASEVSTADLLDILEDITRLRDQGKVKLKLIQKKREAQQRKWLADLRAGSKPLTLKPIKSRPAAEVLSTVDDFGNFFRRIANTRENSKTWMHSMDLLSDMMDGFKRYTGPTYRIFKAGMDDVFNNYLNLRRDTMNEVLELARKHKFDSLAFERIGIYAAAQQEGGRKKLQSMVGKDGGRVVSDAKIDAPLNPAEMEMYTLMRSKLDALLPKLKEVMRVYYNKDVEAITDYFPQLTDTELLSDLNVEDRIGVATYGAPGGFEKKRKNVKKDMTITRVPDAEQNIRLNALDVFIEHVNNTAYLVEAGAKIKDLSDLATSPEYESIAGELGAKTMTEWMNLNARQGAMLNRNRVADFMRKNTGVMVLGYKLTAVLAQIAGFAQASAHIGPTYTSRGMSAVTTSAEWRGMIYTHFGEVRERVGNDPAYAMAGTQGRRDVKTDLKEGKVFSAARTAGKQIQKFSYVPLTRLDAVTAYATAAGAYMRFMEKTKRPINLSKPDPDGVRYAQLMVRKSLASGFAKDTPRLLRENSWTALATQFQSFVFRNWETIRYDMPAAFRDGRPQDAANYILFMSAAVAADQGMRYAANEMWNSMLGVEGEDDEEDPNAVAQVALKFFSQVPIVSSVVSSVQYGSIPVPAVAMTAKALQYTKYSVDEYLKDEEDFDAGKFAKNAFKASLFSAGIGLGVPGVLQGNAIAEDLLFSDEGSNGKWTRD